jgi:hypothetical protein
LNLANDPTRLKEQAPVTTLLQEAGIFCPPLSNKLYLDLPFGALDIQCDNEVAIGELTRTFRHYLHTSSSSGAVYSLNIQAVEEQDWCKLKPCLSVSHSTEEAEYFRWSDGEAVIIHDAFALLVPDSPDAEIFLLVENRQFTDRNEATGRLSLLSNDPDFLIDWSIISDLAKGIYAYRTQTYCLHAALLESNGKGILLVGESGAGKTTSALTLARAGFTLMSDDLVFVEVDSQNAVHATGLLMSPNFVGQGPDCLDDLERTLEQNVTGKTAVNLEQYQVSLSSRTSVIPELVLLLEKPASRSDQHLFSEIDDTAAVAAIMNEIIDPMALPRRFGHLILASALTEQSRVMRLVTGRNLADLCTRVEAELEDV